MITIHSVYEKASGELRKKRVSHTLLGLEESVVFFEDSYKKMVDSWKTSSLPVTDRLKSEIRDTLSPK